MKTHHRAPRAILSPLSLVLIPLLVGVVAIVNGCRERSSNEIQGYIEGDYVYVASPVAGRLVRLLVVKGAMVEAGASLFELDPLPESDQVAEAAARVEQAKSQLENARKGQRPTELAAAEAKVREYEATSQLSALELERARKLHRDKAISDNEYDRARLTHERNLQILAQAKANEETARLGARDDLVAAAEQEVKAASEQLAQAQWRLTQKTQSAPAPSRVEDTLYRVGEWVPAGRPVAVLLPPGNIKVRFFVDEPRMSAIALGRTVNVSLPSASQPVPATVNYVSSKAEFTPPVIYSKENRSKLVFMVEAAVPEDLAATLFPGQPVTVGL